MVTIFNERSVFDRRKGTLVAALFSINMGHILQVNCDNKRISMLFDKDIYVWDMTTLTDFSITKVSGANRKKKLVTPTIVFSLSTKLEESGYDAMAAKIPVVSNTFTNYWNYHNSQLNNVKLGPITSDDENLYGVFHNNFYVYM
jgi:hypothetical protein